MLDKLDAETPRAAKTEVAMTPTKVQCRIEDLAPQPTVMDKRPQAFPVAAVHSPTRTAANTTDRRGFLTRGDHTVDGTGTACAGQCRVTRPTRRPPGQRCHRRSSEFPIRTMSGTEVEETDELELPTPARLTLGTLGSAQRKTD